MAQQWYLAISAAAVRVIAELRYIHPRSKHPRLMNEFVYRKAFVIISCVAPGYPGLLEVQIIMWSGDEVFVLG